MTLATTQMAMRPLKAVGARHRSTPESIKSRCAPVAAHASAWCAALPLLHGLRASLRELRMSDAAALFAALSTEEVARFISPPPATVPQFEQFITWADGERTKGTYVCFAVVPAGSDVAVGIIQLQRLEEASAAEWGFALGQSFWGTGVFADCAALFLQFAFETVGILRLEARSVTANGRGNGALRKAGAILEALLPGSFTCQGRLVDQYLWSISRDDWREEALMRPTIH